MKFTISLFLVLISLSAGAHEYFFGFAELQYNELSQKVEGTLVVTTHDLERYLNDAYEIEEKIEDFDSIQSLTLQKVINQKLKIQFGKKKVLFAVIGIESMLNGVVQIYMESQAVELTNSVSFTFDILMDVFEQQQNKITFRHRDQEYNLTFIASERNRTIQLNEL